MPDVRVEATDEKDFGETAVRTPPDETRRKDAAPVQDEEIAFADDVGQIAKGPMGDGARRSLKDEKP